MHLWPLSLRRTIKVVLISISMGVGWAWLLFDSDSFRPSEVCRTDRTEGLGIWLDSYECFLDPADIFRTMINASVFFLIVLGVFALLAGWINDYVNSQSAKSSSPDG